MASSGDLAAAAHRYAERGWHVHPLQPGRKEPLTAHGFEDATTELEQVAAWWSQWPDANIGVALGPSGLAVIDVDPRNGGDLGELHRAVDLGTPLVAHTGGGGAHLIYGDLGVALRSTLRYAGLDGFDIKASTGYIVVAPSETISPYTWLDDELAVTPMPLAVLDLCRAPARPQPSFVARDAPLDAREVAYVDAALTGVCERLASTPVGERHRAVYYSACCLGEYVGGGVLDRALAHRELTAAAEKLYGEALWKVEATTIEQGLDRGALSPRDVPDEHDRARGLLERIATSDMPGDVLDLYYENNPELLRACRHPELVDERQRAIGHVLDLHGPASADRCVMQLTHA